MSGRIRVLDDALVDQIAAGEVVERPASVVKELLENALDAGATSVTVEVEGGGVERIRVADDGAGMTPEEAPLALRRHATSKIASAQDLHALDTLGFRGEALPSIASVSRFTLTTRTSDVVSATRIRLDGGEPPTVEEIGAAPGTSVEVTDLFYNVPARRKFLKSQATESAHVADTCLRTALSRPGLRLVLVRGGRRVREWLPAPDRAARAKAVFPRETLREMAAERDGVRVLAVLGAPERARTGATGLHLFVNGRPVRDRSLARAVGFAYGSVLPPGRYPTGVVYLDLDPAEVDVNVHPQKAEVRFARGRKILDAVTRMLATQLGTAAWSGPATSGPATRGPEFWAARPAGDTALRGASAPSVPSAGAPTSQPPDREADPWGLGPAMREKSPPYPVTPADASPSSGQHALLPRGGPFGSMRVLGQVRRMLIVCEGEHALHLIDQHAADERVRFHRLRRSHQVREVSTQRLLFPARVEVTAREATLVDEHRDELLGLGLDCAAVGERTVAVHAVPTLVRRAAPDRLLGDVLDELSRDGDRAFGDALDTALATMACHGAIRAGDQLSPEECAALLRSLDEVDDFAGHCPHGRPIAFSAPFGDIERRLGR